MVEGALIDIVKRGPLEIMLVCNMDKLARSTRFREGSGAISHMKYVLHYANLGFC